MYNVILWYNKKKLYSIFFLMNLITVNLPNGVK